MDTPSTCKLQSNENLVDMISQQPDEILVDILSRLPIKEVGRTSVLSKRWRNLWKLTTRLDFDAPEALDKVQSTPCPEIELGPERSKYVAWVNEVLKLHERPSLEEFRVQFDLDASASKDIDEWIKFVILKRVEKIEIDLRSYFRTDQYTPSQECLHYLKSVSNLPNIMCIRSLSLGQVNVAGELVEYLLSKCPQLEMLSLSSCNHLGKLKVAGPSLPLKYLNIYICKSLESIELCAPKLETFVYFGERENFVVGKNPLLVNLSIGGGQPYNVVGNCLGQFSSHFSQLETLSLRMRFKDDSDLPEVGKFGNLKHLKLDIGVLHDVSLIGFRRFIMAAPSLTKLTLKLSVSLPLALYTRERAIQPHGCLKEVEIFGYNGCCCMFQFARYLGQSAVNLEKMVLDPRHPHLSRSQTQIEEQAGIVRLQADQLRGSLPPGAKLIVRA